MWIIQYEDNLLQQRGILAHAVEDRHTCELVMLEFTRSWINDHPAFKPTIHISQTQEGAQTPGVVIGNDIGEGIINVLLELTAFRIHGIVAAHPAVEAEEHKVVTATFDQVDVEELVSDGWQREVLH